MTSRPVGGESTVAGDGGNQGREAATEATGTRGGSTVADVSAGRRWSGGAFVCVYSSGKIRYYYLGGANDAVLHRSCHEPLRHNTKSIEVRPVKKNDISSRWGRKCGHASHQVGGARYWTACIDRASTRSTHKTNRQTEDGASYDARSFLAHAKAQSLKNTPFIHDLQAA